MKLPSYINAFTCKPLHTVPLDSLLKIMYKSSQREISTVISMPFMLHNVWDKISAKEVDTVSISGDLTLVWITMNEETDGTDVDNDGGG